ncbi:MAG TPA: tRNA pseudouridine(38-40) synthase TruA, partial [Candidatus Goldiibacteriota bacterium]|nr:tRNA pseudouridine(38-40) synthase TruA [Candidatus Goldiibacteriota bacterium]
MSQKTFKCTVSYRGTAYYGWQRQSELPTVQGLIEFSLEKFFGHHVKTAGASRTDAGVHAYGQVFSFSVDTKIPAANIMRALNDILPHDIRIIACEEKPG